MGTTIEGGPRTKVSGVAPRENRVKKKKKRDEKRVCFRNPEEK